MEKEQLLKKIVIEKVGKMSDEDEEKLRDILKRLNDEGEDKEYEDFILDTKGVLFHNVKGDSDSYLNPVLRDYLLETKGKKVYDGGDILEVEDDVKEIRDEISEYIHCPDDIEFGVYIVK